MFVCLTVLLAHVARADYESQTTKTNVNEQTDLFAKSIDDHKALEKQLEQDKAAAMRGLGEDPEGLKYISTKSSSQIDSEVAELKSIKANNLSSKGREEFLKSKDAADLDALYPDYQKSLNIQYKKDAEKIAEGTDDLLANLLGKLKELGVDCKTIKGNKIMEPEYTIKIKEELTRDKGETQYDQALCEEPRNQYICANVLSVKCLDQGKGGSESATIRFAENEMPAHWWLGRGWDGGNSDGYTTNLFLIFNANLMEEVKQKIAQKIGYSEIEVPQQQIMIFGGQRVGYEINEKGEYGTVHAPWQEVEDISGSIRFYYKVSKEPVCNKWQEEWIERCKIQ